MLPFLLPNSAHGCRHACSQCGRPPTDHEHDPNSQSTDKWTVDDATKDQCATFGTVKFTKQTQQWLPRSVRALSPLPVLYSSCWAQAPFIRLSSTDSPLDVVNLVKQIFTKRHDKYRPPRF